MHFYNWMQTSINQLYEQIKDIKTKKKFEEEISRRQKEYDGLLNKETAALLIVDELGRNQQNISKITDLRQSTETTVFGRVTKIGELRSFNRKNGSVGRVINLELSDETGTCGLALWDDDVGLVKNNKRKKGSNLKIINGYVKDGFKGIELNSGRWSIIEVEPDDMPVIKEGKINNVEEKIRGTIVEKEPTRSFFKDNGDIGFVTNIKLRNEKGVQQITIWDEKVKEIQKFKTGDTLDISNIDFRTKNNVTEIHINGRAVIKKR